MRTTRFPLSRRATLVGACLTATAAGAALAAPPTPGHAASVARAAPLRSRVWVNGATLTHPRGGGRVAVSNPDDITSLGGRIFVAFQNGVGPQGQPSPTGNRDSTIVEFTPAGRELRQWDLTGKCDGLGVDPGHRRLIVTVNEDANSSLYVIDPAAVAPVHYRYSRPLASAGGTDAVDVYHGMILISASAPGTTGASAPQKRYPAVYAVTLTAARHTADVRGLFSDEAVATVANAGHASTTKLGLTDPDSNHTVPGDAARFRGDFGLTSQGDKEQIFVSGAGTAHQRLRVLKLSRSIDDSAWAPSAPGRLYVTDTGADRIDLINGRFRRGEQIVSATPCDAGSAPATCPAPGFPANYLATLNPVTGTVTALRVTGTRPAAQGLLFLP